MAKPATGVRTKAYHFDDPPPPRTHADGADVDYCSSEMERAAHTLVPHQPPMRRHTILSHQPNVATPVVQSVNNLATPAFVHPVVTPPVIRVLWSGCMMIRI